MQAGATLKIMPLGDSRTAGPDSRNCYRLYLDRMMSAAGYSYDFVGSLKGVGGGNKADSVFDDNHEGHWGWTIDNLLPRLGGYARSYRPDIVLALLGTTDILQENDTTESLDAKLSRTIGEMGAAIDTLQAVNDSVVIFLALLYGVVSLEHTMQIESLNVRIPLLAAAKTKGKSRVMVVDLWSAANRVGDLWDAYHANKYGSIKIANQWLGSLWPFFGSAPPLSMTRFFSTSGIHSAARAQPLLGLPWTILKGRDAAFFDLAGRRAVLKCFPASLPIARPAFRQNLQ